MTDAAATRRTSPARLAAALLAAAVAAALALPAPAAPALASEDGAGLLGRLIALSASSAPAASDGGTASDATAETGLEVAERALREAVLAGETGEVPLDGLGAVVTDADFREAFSEVVREPRCFHVLKATHTTVERGGEKVVVSFSVEYRLQGHELAVYQEQLDQVLANVVATVDPAATDYDKCLYVYRWLIDNVSYDHETADSGEKSSVSRTPLGPLAYGKGVCSGYTSAYLLVLQELGIACQYVHSDSMNHDWAAVYLDGAWHYADPTWDDQGDGADAQYFYFMVGADTLGRDHSGWEPAIEGTADLYRPGIARFSPSEYSLSDAVLSVVRNAWPDMIDVLDYQVSGEELDATFQALNESGAFAGAGRFSYTWFQNEAGHVTEFYVRFL